MSDNGFRVQSPDDPNNHTTLWRVYRPEDPTPAMAHSTHATAEEATAACDKANSEPWGWPPVEAGRN